MTIASWRDLLDFIRWLWSEDPAPERHIAYAIELEEVRADFAVLRRVASAGVIIAAAVAAGYVLGAMR